MRNIKCPTLAQLVTNFPEIAKAHAVMSNHDYVNNITKYMFKDGSTMEFRINIERRAR